MARRRKKGRPISGWVILDKPLDMTSTQAVGKLKWLFQAQKAGHAGTLDPLASGILPIALGEATKTVPFLMEAQKTYAFTIKWGESRDTADAEGDVIATSDKRPSVEEIEALIPQYLGNRLQTPPKYSAIKIDGERAYDLARAGEDFKLKAREVTLHDFKIMAMETSDETAFQITCGKGYYVRSLAQDMAKALGAEGYISSLRRLSVGPFEIEQSFGLAKLEEMRHKGALQEALMPLHLALDDIPAIDVNKAEASSLKQGRAIVLLPHILSEWQDTAGQNADGSLSRLACAMMGEEAVGLCEIRAGRANPTRIFNIQKVDLSAFKNEMTPDKGET